MKKNGKQFFSALLILTVLLASMAGGAAYAKYVTDIKLPQGSVTITANLGKIAIAQGASNHLLIPGHDFAVDNQITISDKSPIPCYVFVEVLDNFGSDGYVSYAPSANWIKLDAVTGKNGGTVYRYKEQVIANCTLPVDFNVIVSQELKSAKDKNGNAIYPGGSVTMTFHAFLVQASNRTPEDAYNSVTP